MRGEFDNYNISFNFWSLLMHTRVVVGFLLIKRDVEGGRSCTGARVDLSRFTHFLEIFGQKKVPFWVKTVLLGQEVHYYMVYIAYFTDLILQICDYAQK